MPKEMGIYLFQDKFILKSLLHVKVLGCGQQFNIEGSIYIYIYIYIYMQARMSSDRFRII
jgi:hypothetical protein